MLYEYHSYYQQDDFEWTSKYVNHKSRKEKKLPLIGIELEIDKNFCREDGGEDELDIVLEDAGEIRDRIARGCDDKYHIICSEDGSLNYGFELISQPATIEYHLSGKGYDWKAGLNEATERGYLSGDVRTCGLHFHVSRDFLGKAIDDYQMNIVAILLKNAEWLKKFSMRTNFCFCEFPHIGTFGPVDVKKFKESPYDRMEETARVNYLVRDLKGHHKCLNFAGSQTVEFRFMRGTLNYTQFAAALQMVTLYATAAARFRFEQCCALGLDWFVAAAKAAGYNEFLERAEILHLADFA